MRGGVRAGARKAEDRQQGTRNRGERLLRRGSRVQGRVGVGSARSANSANGGNGLHGKRRDAGRGRHARIGRRSNRVEPGRGAQGRGGRKVHGRKDGNQEAPARRNPVRRWARGGDRIGRHTRIGRRSNPVEVGCGAQGQGGRQVHGRKDGNQEAPERRNLVRRRARGGGPIGRRSNPVEPGCGAQGRGGRQVHGRKDGNRKAPERRDQVRRWAGDGRLRAAGRGRRNGRTTGGRLRGPVRTGAPEIGESAADRGVSKPALAEPGRGTQ